MLLVGGGVLAISTSAFFRVSLLPDLGDALAMSPTALGLFTTVFAVGRLTADIPSGRLADRAPVSRAFVHAGAVVVAGSILLALAPAAEVAILAAFVLGVGSSISNTTGMTWFSASAPRARRGRSLAVFSGALLVGQALGPALAGSLSLLVGWRGAAAGGAVLGAATAVVFVSFGRLLRAGDRETTGPERAIRAPRPLQAPLRREVIVLYSVSFALFFTLGSLPQTLVPLIGADEFGLSAATIGLVLGLGGGCRLIGVVVGGVVSDRVSRKAVLVTGLLLMAAGVALLAVGQSVASWLSGIVLMSLGSFGPTAGATILADRTPTGSIGRRLGTFRFVGDLGLLFGPLVVGLLFEQAGQAVSILAVTGLLAVCALAAGLALRREDA